MTLKVFITLVFAVVEYVFWEFISDKIITAILGSGDEILGNDWQWQLFKYSLITVLWISTIIGFIRLFRPFQRKS